MITGLPTKSNTIWTGLVDINKVYVASEWLKENNNLYSDIIIDYSYLYAKYDKTFQYEKLLAEQISKSYLKKSNQTASDLRQFTVIDR